VRTIRRRIAEGELSATKERRGANDVTVLDPSEVARFAEAQGQTMALPQGTEGNEGQTAAPVCDTEGHVPSSASGQTDAKQGQVQGNGGAQGATQSAEVGHVRALQEQVRALTEERDFLRRVLENVTKALPSGEESVAQEPEPVAEERRPWWARLFRGKREEANV
jgi:hypothetical protein